MQQNNNYPDIDPASTKSLEGVIRFAFYKMMQKTDGCLPAKVLKYDRDNNTAQVQIMTNKVSTGGEVTLGSQIPNVPVMTMGGGNFVINFPLKEGDLGFVFAMDRNISNFIQSLKASSPQVNTLKNFVSSVFVPSVIRGYTISGEDDDSLVIQNLSGSVKISLSNDSINIEAPEVNIDSPSINIESSSMVKMTTPMLHVEGSIEATGSITPDVPPL